MNLPKNNQYIQRKGSTVKWQVWSIDNDTISLMHYRNGKGLRITHTQYQKNWQPASQGTN